MRDFWIKMSSILKKCPHAPLVPHAAFSSSGQSVPDLFSATPVQESYFDAFPPQKSTVLFLKYMACFWQEPNSEIKKKITNPLTLLGLGFLINYLDPGPENPNPQPEYG